MGLNRGPLGVAGMPGCPFFVQSFLNLGGERVAALESKAGAALRASA